MSTPNAVHRAVDPGRELMGAVTKEMETFAVGAQRFNGTRQLWKDSMAPLLSALPPLAMVGFLYIVLL